MLWWMVRGRTDTPSLARVYKLQREGGEVGGGTGGEGPAGILTTSPSLKFLGTQEGGSDFQVGGSCSGDPTWEMR